MRVLRLELQDSQSPSRSALQMVELFVGPLAFEVLVERSSAFGRGLEDAIGGDPGSFFTTIGGPALRALWRSHVSQFHHVRYRFDVKLTSLVTSCHSSSTFQSLRCSLPIQANHYYAPVFCAGSARSGADGALEIAVNCRGET